MSVLHKAFRAAVECTNMYHTCRDELGDLSIMGLVFEQGVGQFQVISVLVFHHAANSCNQYRHISLFAIIISLL